MNKPHPPACANMPWTVDKLTDMTHEIQIEWDRKTNWQQWVLLTSDRHWDNPYSDQKMQKRHLQQAMERQAPVVDIGDLFCAMQGVKDRRAAKSNIRPEHNVTNYFDALVNTATDWFMPYQPVIALLGKGNHETSIYKHNETDLTARLARRLGVHAGRYGGYIRFKFNSEKGKTSDSKVMRYFHGSGGAAPVTKGVIQTNRRAVKWPDADIVVSGHIHEAWDMPIVQERIDQYGNVRDKEQLHVSLPTYKVEQRKDGWHDQRGAPPKPIGAKWLRFFNNGYGKLDFEVTRAK